MYRILLCLSLAFLVARAQYQQPQQPSPYATNYQTGDQARQESVDNDGNVAGQYSYVDPDGKTITVKYTAGKDGFRVVGDHLPVAPQAPAYQPEPYQQQPYQQPYQQPSYQQPSYQPSLYQQPQPQQYSPQNLQNVGFNPHQQLFTPAAPGTPAVTAGQYQNYRSALAEERQDQQRSQQPSGPFGQQQGSHVSVNYGQDQSYSYEISI